MLLLALGWLLWEEGIDRTPAIYRCPAAEAESPKLQDLIDSAGFSYLCIDPAPGPNARLTAKDKKVAITGPASIDTPANRRWRDAAISMAAGNISPKAWLARTRDLHETVHFLSSPSTPPLRSALANESRTAVFAEALLLSWPGKPCLTSGDIWKTREFPDPGPLQNWVLAMNDYLGPMLQYRHDNPVLVTHAPSVIRADAQPGLLIFQQKTAKKTITFYFNNSKRLMKLPPIHLDSVIGDRGLYLEGAFPQLHGGGSLVEEIAISESGSGLIPK